MSAFLREALDVNAITGGSRGNGRRIVEQMKRLFGSLVSASYTGINGKGFELRNVLIAEDVSMHDKTGDYLWTPQTETAAGVWKSQVRLTDKFYREIVERPVPIDLRAYRTLRGSPLAMDLYTWLSYRNSYLSRPTHPIRWEALMGQFGSGYGTREKDDAQRERDHAQREKDHAQAVRDFRKNFIQALKLVHLVYPQAQVNVEDKGFPRHRSSQQHGHQMRVVFEMPVRARRELERQTGQSIYGHPQTNSRQADVFL